MRPTCTHCAIKHLSQAMITLSESRQGYPTHRFYALGHMAEAGDELAKEYPKYAEMIRAERKKLEDDPDYTPDFKELIETVDEECSVCQLEPGSPPLENPSRGARRTNPIAWTKCEKLYPSVQRKIESCVLKLEGDPRVRSPIAVCRTAIKCPPR